MKVFLLLVAPLLGCVGVSAGDDCLLPVPDPQRLFRGTPGANVQELGKVPARKYKDCVSQCCEQSEGACNVVLFHKTHHNSEDAGTNCAMYLCQPVSGCNFTAQDGVEIYAAADAVLATTAKNDVLPSTLPATSGDVVNSSHATTPAAPKTTKMNVTTAAATSPTMAAATERNTEGAAGTSPLAVAPSERPSTESSEVIPAQSSGTNETAAVSSTERPTTVGDSKNNQTTLAASLPKELTSQSTGAVEDVTSKPASNSTGAAPQPTTPQRNSSTEKLVTTNTLTHAQPSSAVNTTQQPTLSSPKPAAENTSVAAGQMTPAVVSTNGTQEQTPALDVGTNQPSAPTQAVVTSSQLPSATQTTVDTQAAANETTHQTNATQDLARNATKTTSMPSAAGNATSTHQELSSDSGLSVASRTFLIGALSVGCLFFFTVVVLVGKRVFEGWKKRHYSRIDYLVDGMYHE